MQFCSYQQVNNFEAFVVTTGVTLSHIKTKLGVQMSSTLTTTTTVKMKCAGADSQSSRSWQLDSCLIFFLEDISTSIKKVLSIQPCGWKVLSSIHKPSASNLQENRKSPVAFIQTKIKS